VFIADVACCALRNCNTASTATHTHIYDVQKVMPYTRAKVLRYALYMRSALHALGHRRPFFVSTPHISQSKGSKYAANKEKEE
jgi:hypothetical protein